MTGWLKEIPLGWEGHSILGRILVPLNWGVSGVAWQLLIIATGIRPPPDHA